MAPGLEKCQKRQEQKKTADEHAARDIKDLLKSFADLKTVRFEAFVTVWREKGYSLLQGAAEIDRRPQFLESLCGIFLYDLRSDNVLNCVASIYGIFCIISTQGCRPKLKVRLTPELYARIEQVQQWAREEHHCDVDYIIRQLKWQSVFHLVAFPSMLCIGSGKTYLDGEGGTLKAFLNHHAESYLPEAISAGDLEDLERLCSEYHSSKLLLDQSGGVALNLVEKDFTKDVKSLLDDHETWKMESREKARQSESEQQPHSRAERTVSAEIRERSYSRTVKPRKRQHTRESDGELSPEPPLRKGRRKLTTY